MRHTEEYKGTLGAQLAAKVRLGIRIQAGIANTARQQGITANHEIAQHFNSADISTSHGIRYSRRHQKVKYSAPAPLATHGVKLDCLNGDPVVALGTHIFVNSKVKWEIIADGIPRYQEWPSK